MNDIFSDIGFLALRKGLEVGTLRQEILSTNISNITTPNYKSREVKFEELLKDRLSFKISMIQTHPMHLSTGRERLEPVVAFSDRDVPTGSVNNVDLDHDMVELAKNSLSWDTLIRLLSLKYRTLMSSVTGGRR